MIVGLRHALHVGLRHALTGAHLRLGDTLGIALRHCQVPVAGWHRHGLASLRRDLSVHCWVMLSSHLSLCLLGRLWSLLGYGFWTVREKATGRFVGEVGYADFHRGLTPVLETRPEIGWVLSSAAQGRGFASEAVAAALDWGRARWGAGEVACIIAEGNAPSFRVAERMGFRAVGDEDYRGVPMRVLVRAL